LRDGAGMTQTPAGRRVLQVIESTLGGTRRYLEDVFDALGPGPHNGLAYSLHRADTGFLELLERIRSAGWTLYEIDMHRRIDPIHDAACVFAMRKVFRQFRPDVVHAHSSKAGAVARLATIGMTRRPGLVYSPHSIGVNLGRIFGLIERVLAMRLDVLSAVTPSEREELRALNLVPPSRIHVIVPTIRPDIFLPADRSAARSLLDLPDGPLVIAIGRLTAQKDPLAFAEFVHALRARIRPLRAVWIGDGELRGAFKERIEELQLGNVLSITGWLDDVRNYVAACDLLVSTSSYESFGYVTAEALAMSRPVVASAITGTVDIVTTSVDEQLYRYRDIAAAVTLAERLLLDPERARAVATSGRDYVLSTFSTLAMRTGLANAYSVASTTAGR
jgi:glycosyltransferase involved in cell wall biosynthesis